MSAAQAAAAAGLSVILVDERPTLGGQIFKQPGLGFTVSDPGALDSRARLGRALIESVESLGGGAIDLRLRTSLVAAEGHENVLVTEGEHATTVVTPRTVVATGAHDRPVAFPGWTLPGVITAGGLQTLAKSQRVLPGRRMLFAGSGPVALAFPAQLAHYGAHIVEALEAGPAPRPEDVARILHAARGNADVLRDAMRYRTMLLRHRVPLHYRRIIVRAEGDGRVEHAVHAAVDRDWRVIPGTERAVDVDVICVGYGFVPSIELPRLLGCAFDHNENLGGHVLRRDEWMRTTVPGVYAAGDGAGVEGCDVAIDEGTISGIAAALDSGALDPDRATTLAFPARRRITRRRGLTAATGRLYPVGRGIYELFTPDTTVCRCEGVRAATLSTAIDATDDINVVKSYTRAGMGPCQGRNCQRQIAAMIAERHGRSRGHVALPTARMPLRPVPISAMADHAIPDPGLFLAADAAP